MGAETSLKIDSSLSAFVEAEIAAGKYRSANDVVNEGLKLLQQRERKRAALEALLIEGEESGEPQPFDNEAFMAEKRAKYGVE